MMTMIVEFVGGPVDGEKRPVGLPLPSFVIVPRVLGASVARIETWESVEQPGLLNYRLMRNKQGRPRYVLQAGAR